MVSPWNQGPNAPTPLLHNITTSSSLLENIVTGREEHRKKLLCLRKYDSEDRLSLCPRPPLPAPDKRPVTCLQRGFMTFPLLQVWAGLRFTVPWLKDTQKTVEFELQIRR